MSARPDAYAFGIPPRDPFDPATCPACRSPVGPATPCCGHCLATYDDEAARRHLLRPPTAMLARMMPATLAGVGVLALGAGGFASSVGVAPSGWWLGLAAALVVVGSVGWLTFPRRALLVSVVVGITFALLAVGVIGSLATVTGSVLGGRGVVALLVLLGSASVTSFRGVTVGRQLARLHVVARPAASPETYR